MKIKVKQKVEPQIGDTKEKVRFAFFPRKIEDTWVWLEKYIATYKYMEYYYENEVVVSQGLFTEKYYTEPALAIGWVVIDRKLIDKP